LAQCRRNPRIDAIVTRLQRAFQKAVSRRLDGWQGGRAVGTEVLSRGVGANHTELCGGLQSFSMEAGINVNTLLWNEFSMNLPRTLRGTLI